MKNKGFTLIEILAVIVILMILITLITPKVFKQLKTAENITDQEQINTIINISKIYMNQNTDLLPEENNIYTISIDELKQSGLIQTKQILNPSTKEELTGYIIVKNENNKYKYEYKEENELITVTFDSQGGTIQQTSKKLLTGEKYGTLPTPTREGYTFVGWQGKNLAPEINDGNYTFYHHYSRTSSEFKNENGENYIRINGNQGNENIDTLWILYSINKRILYQGDYVLSFDVRSANSVLSQSIGKIIPGSGNTIGRTGLYKRYNLSWKFEEEYLLSNIEKSFTFDNDGEWHHFSSKVNIPYSVNDALIEIGNDAPNLYGTNSYLDIKNIQLERGDTATSYEPYQEYTKDTIVTKRDNHTLYAIWQTNS